MVGHFSPKEDQAACVLDTIDGNKNFLTWNPRILESLTWNGAKKITIRLQFINYSHFSHSHNFKFSLLGPLLRSKRPKKASAKLHQKYNPPPKFIKKLYCKICKFVSFVNPTFFPLKNVSNVPQLLSFKTFHWVK